MFQECLNYCDAHNFIGTNEIPGELSRENMISSHMWTFLWLHHKSPLSKQKNIKKKWFGISLVFTLIYIMIRTLHSRMKIRNFSSCMLKNISRVSCALVKYYSTLEEKFGISARPCNILYVCSAQRRGYPQKRLFSFVIVISYSWNSHFQ